MALGAVLVDAGGGVLGVGSEAGAFVGAGRRYDGGAGYHARGVAGRVVAEEGFFVCDGDGFDLGLVGIDERRVVLVLADL